MAVNILIVSPIPTHPNNSGNRARLYSLLKSLQQTGCLISFLYLEKWPGANLTAMRNEWDHFESIKYTGFGSIRKLSSLAQKILGITFPNIRGAIDNWASKSLILKNKKPFGIDDWYDPGIDIAIKRLIGTIHIDAVIVEYVYLSKALDIFGGNVIKIIDTHDVFSNRHQQFISLGRNPVFFFTSPEEESKGLNRADLIVAIQDEDRRFLTGLCQRHVISIGHLPPFVSQAISRSIPRHPLRLLYVATDIVPNQDAMDFFVDAVWPIISSKYPNIEIDIVGEIGFHLRNRVGQNFRLHYQVDDIASFYNSNCIVINPIRIGTGLKIKNVEALFMGRPLITTSIGAQGLGEWAGKAFMVADDATGFANCVFHLFSDDVACETLSKGALQFSLNYQKDYEKSVSNLISKITPK